MNDEIIGGTASKLKIPQQVQRQDSLEDQLRDLHIVAARLGCYDAADWLWAHIMPLPQSSTEIFGGLVKALVTDNERERVQAQALKTQPWSTEQKSSVPPSAATTSLRPASVGGRAT